MTVDASSDGHTAPVSNASAASIAPQERDKPNPAAGALRPLALIRSRFAPLGAVALALIRSRFAPLGAVALALAWTVFVPGIIAYKNGVFFKADVETRMNCLLLHEPSRGTLPIPEWTALLSDIQRRYSNWQTSVNDAWTASCREQPQTDAGALASSHNMKQLVAELVNTATRLLLRTRELQQTTKELQYLLADFDQANARATELAEAAEKLEKSTAQVKTKTDHRERLPASVGFENSEITLVFLCSYIGMLGLVLGGCIRGDASEAPERRDPAARHRGWQRSIQIVAVSTILYLCFTWTTFARNWLLMALDNGRFVYAYTNVDIDRASFWCQEARIVILMWLLAMFWFQKLDCMDTLETDVEQDLKNYQCHELRAS
jgi:hypothetical protein